MKTVFKKKLNLFLKIIKSYIIINKNCVQSILFSIDYYNFHCLIFFILTDHQVRMNVIVITKGKL